MPDAEEQIGTWTGVYDYEFKLPHLASSSFSSSSSTRTIDLFSWDDARKVKQTITAELDKKLRNNEVNLLRFVGNVPEFFEGKIGKERGESFELSNVGVFKAPGNVDGVGGWKVGRCTFSQCSSVTGAAIQVSSATGGDGNAVLMFSWSESDVGREVVDRVIEGVEEGVEDIIQGKDGVRAEVGVMGKDKNV